MAAELALDRAPRAGPDRLDHAPAGADQDALLRLGLDQHHRLEPNQIRRCCSIVLDLDLDRVRHLLTRPGQDLLAYQLGEHHRLGLIRALTRLEVERALGQQRDEVVEQLVHAAARAGRDREDRVARRRARRHRGARCTVLRAIGAVDLVDRDHDRDVERPLCSRPAMKRSPGPMPCSALKTIRQPSASCQLVLDPPLHPLGERVARTLDAWQVDQHQLPVRDPGDGPDRAPGRLRLVGDDRDLAAHERVRERRFADVGPAGQCDRNPESRHRTQRISSDCSASISPSSTRGPCRSDAGFRG